MGYVMHLSINPLYRCNFRCTRCYLSPQQLGDKTLLDLDFLENTLARLPPLDYVELYGGEITLLPEAYVTQMVAIIKRYYHGKISIITNLFLVPDYFYDPCFELSVSYDFEHRPHHERVLENIATLGREIAVIVLATPEVMQGDVDAQISTLMAFKHITKVDIKPYSNNAYNSALGTNRAYAQYVRYWIEHADPDRLKNVDVLETVVAGTRNAFSSDHLYITPDSQLAVLEFDHQDREYFLPLKDYGAYLDWCQHERTKVAAMACQQCPYKGRCLTEHYRNHEGVFDECSGFRSLIDWYVATEA